MESSGIFQHHVTCRVEILQVIAVNVSVRGGRDRSNVPIEALSWLVSSVVRW